MIRLGKIPLQPYWLPILAGVRFQVRAPETALCAAADLATSNAIAAGRQAFDDAKKTGAPWTGANWDDEAVRVGLIRHARAVAYGEAAIVAWEGVYPATGDTPAELCTATVADLMRIGQIAQIFLDEYLASLLRQVIEGNGSGPAPNGMPAAVPTTAAAATTESQPAPAAEEEQTASAALT